MGTRAGMRKERIMGSRGRDSQARGGGAPLLSREDDVAPSAAERAWRLILVAARNAVGLVGILFFSWSAPTLVVLYFADTLAGMWAVFAAIGFKLSNVDPRQGFWTVAEGASSGIAVALFLVAVVAVPLGIPLVFVFGASGAGWRQVWADPTLTAGIGVLALTGLVGAIRHVFTLAEGRTGGATVKQAFAILMTRWVLVLLAIYTMGGLLGRLGLYVVVVVYAAASAWSELAPARFARLIPDRRPPDSR
jgi:hypothetical protein